jgi:hypothetical protein
MKITSFKLTQLNPNLDLIIKVHFSVDTEKPNKKFTNVLSYVWRYGVVFCKNP